MSESFRVFCKAIDRHLQSINAFSHTLDQLYGKNPTVEERLMAVAEHELEQASDALRRGSAISRKPDSSNHNKEGFHHAKQKT